MTNIAKQIHARKATLAQRGKVIMLKLEREVAPHRQVLDFEVNSIIRSEQSLDKKLERLHKLESKLRSFATSSTACKRGCANCCYDRTDISATEAQMIGKAIGTKPATMRANYEIPNINTYGRHTPCPFLVDNDCSIYEHRPFMCRSIANFDVDALLCSFENVELFRNGDSRSTPVPLFPSYLTDVYSFLIQGDVIADIRDFFPND